jgi:predicted Zn-dependent protease
MINSMGWAAAMLVLIGDINVVTAVVVHQLGSLYFGREKEEKADMLGLELLIANDINPNGMLTLMQRLEDESNVELPEWISSHPTTSERISLIETQINAKPCKSCQTLSYNWKIIKADPSLSIKSMSD